MDILEFLYIVIDAFIIIYGTEILLNVKTKSKLKLFFVGLNIIGGSLTFLPFQEANEYSTMVGIALYLVYLILITKNKRENIILGILWFISIGLISVAVNYVFIIRMGLNGNIARHIVIIIAKAIILGLLYLIYLLKKRDGFASSFIFAKEDANSKLIMNKEIILLLLFYVIIVILLFSAYFIMNKMYLYSELQHIVNTIIISIITLLILSFIFIKVLTRLYTNILNENEMNAYLTKEMEIISKSKDEYDKLQIVRHDLKHYMCVLKEMLSENSKKEIIAYIDDVIDVINNDAKYRIKLDDKLLESVINTKLDDMRNENIEVYSFVLNYSNYRNVNNVALILMNLLDNAKEAALRCDGFKEVSIKSMMIGEYIKFEISNTCPPKQEFKLDEIQTSKKNKALHGLGIKSILSVVEEENGIIDFRHIGDKFEVDLLIPK